ncbi:exopolysaccharide biosynthesis protein [Chelatococcus reniformis]|uniref:Exopolysaccharide biosynthesis protein n=1 Tax=Chelatococcus reniformis TaxID=1494448 RepID=A0A916UAW9_9HYPH|nr:exopolysaccharide biosynthesis protein [Chelatococcus reniformis]GGC65861.1 hypothetical protein GCM10010994_25570 [Chelatococcus reniformis]
MRRVLRRWFARTRQGPRGPIVRDLLDVARGVNGERATVGTIIDRLGMEGLGLALLLLTLPTMIPLPGPVGLVLGALMALISVQIMAGASQLWLPRIVRERTVPVPTLRLAIAAALPWIVRAERWLCEQRLSFLTGPRARMALALPVLALALAIMAPIPFGNLAPAIAMVAFALGLMARDGAAILVGLLLTVPALTVITLLIVASTSLIGGAASIVR